MNRLTRRFTDGTAFVPNEIKALHNEQQEYINKLAAYEDTGLEPEEVKHFTNVCQEAGETYNCHFNYVVKCVLEHEKLKELLKKAVKDFKILGNVCPTDIDCVDCPLYNSKSDKCDDIWNHADEVEEILNENRAIQR